MQFYFCHALHATIYYHSTNYAPEPDPFITAFFKLYKPNVNLKTCELSERPKEVAATMDAAYPTSTP
jgi:hypothetical protein